MDKATASRPGEPTNGIGIGFTAMSRMSTELGVLQNSVYPRIRNWFIGLPERLPYMIGIAGAGKVGAQSALEIASTGLDDISLVDIIPGLAEGEALDI
ncbi:MAG TPA: hypothetical protein VEC08_04560, partial [Nitrososphaerales archaeon]|nr:hypothetical protein [Nitrososphaerales archaeon]